MIVCAKKNNDDAFESRANPNFTGLNSNLLNFGADPELSNDFGWTALMCACAVKSVHPDHSILLILSAGVDPNCLSIYSSLAQH